MSIVCTQASHRRICPDWTHRARGQAAVRACSTILERSKLITDGPGQTATPLGLVNPWIGAFVPALPSARTSSRYRGSGSSPERRYIILTPPKGTAGSN